MKEFLPPSEFLQAYGLEGPAWPLEKCIAYTRWLARSHYENFHVVSWLLPRGLHPDFFNVYAFCRWSDDLADEMGDRQRSLELLEWWRHELAEMYVGRVKHPVYVALRNTLKRHDIPEQTFADLIHAFVQDQKVSRYPAYDDLLGYCRYSANPVGRLVLHLCGYTDEERRRLSDFTCTALQLANFWQDVRRDWRIGRVYIPLERMETHGYSVETLEQDIQKGAGSENFRAVMRGLVDDAEDLFQKGFPLTGKVDRRLAVDIELFSRGGMAILEMIRRQGYDTISKRPKLGKFDRVSLLVRVLARHLIIGSRSSTEARRARR